MSQGPPEAQVAAARQAALALPGAVEAAHMGRPDFRVGGRIFASLHAAEAVIVLKLRPEQQALHAECWPEAFAPVPGGWGRQGWTRLHLGACDAEMLRDALAAAWRNVAPKRLVGLLEPGEAATSAPARNPRN